MNSLPVRIRQNIRDHITSPQSPVSLKFKSVSTILGYPVNFDPEWPILWAISKEHYPDPATFVPTLATVLTAWCDAFISWLENPDNEETVDILLDKLKEVGRFELVLNTSPDVNRLRTTFDLHSSKFVIVLPPTQRMSASESQSSFASDLLDYCKVPTTVVSDEPDWADIAADSPHSHAITSGVQKLSVEPAETLPDLATIQRPEVLTKSPPYWLIVRQEGRDRVRVEGSHGPSLGILEAYLKKWSRSEVHVVNNPPIVQVKLRESPFGLGPLHDTLILETSRGREISATLVLVLVENVLGYDPIVGNPSGGGLWEFKRTRAFK
ncbi:hypothetical protein OIDMADRAFT_184416 [Oidiodendron maius Zn]|uniref:Uncharacterized protein n=1 Tax=Oidiodendron maius (strain Zn) TaxID=913774 RepID=A0A0C3C629_OIDMZ|nr:hypothetical protein OIDMADRAFT_184416 [Oidiodendron maius Zn]